MQRIAFFSENLYGGGVERILQTVLGHFDYERYDITLWSNRHETLDYSIYPSRLKYKWIFDSELDDSSIIKKWFVRLKNKTKLLIYYHLSPSLFYRLFVRESYNCAIAFIEGYSTRIVSGAPKAVKKIAWVHTDLIDNHWTSVAFRGYEEEKKIYRIFDRIVCVSSQIEQVMQERFGLNGKTVIIYNPIDKERIKKLSMEPIPSEFAEKDCVRIATMGSLIPVKGYNRLIRSVSELVALGYEFELVIIGGGKLEKELKEAVQQLGIENQVRFTGYLPNPFPIILSSDFYVCSSYAEGFNTSISEAIILNKPVVSTNCSGVKEQLGDSEFGIVTDNDDESLKKGISMMLDKKVFDYYSTRIVERCNLFSVDNSMRKIMKMIDELR